MKKRIDALTDLNNIHDFIAHFQTLKRDKDTKEIRRLFESIPKSNNVEFIVTIIRVFYPDRLEIKYYNNYIEDAYIRIKELGRDPEDLLIELIDKKTINKIEFLRKINE